MVVRLEFFFCVSIPPRTFPTTRRIRTGTEVELLLSRRPSGVAPRGGGRTYVNVRGGVLSSRDRVPCAARRENATVLGARTVVRRRWRRCRMCRALRLAGSLLSRPAPPPAARPVPDRVGGRAGRRGMGATGKGARVAPRPSHPRPTCPSRRVLGPAARRPPLIVTGRRAPPETAHAEAATKQISPPDDQFKIRVFRPVGSTSNFHRSPSVRDETARFSAKNQSIRGGGGRVSVEKYTSPRERMTLAAVSNTIIGQKPAADYVRTGRVSSINQTTIVFTVIVKSVTLY